MKMRKGNEKTMAVLWEKATFYSDRKESATTWVVPHPLETNWVAVGGRPSSETSPHPQLGGVHPLVESCQPRLDKGPTRRWAGGNRVANVQKLVVLHQQSTNVRYKHTIGT